ncbi:hypothetical protein CHS0354_013282 [Potamilus streckersoni]|uniref:FERM domain-containing protein n=1 Tax=Potamilus streckersoni TaxID=2493646 RepID=A0AAE0SZ86_9BIVA|nr:hypothetical protein CHS0354_013282 [Potamilus streckersoni]
MSSLSGSHTAGKKRKVISVILLNKEEYFVYVDVKAKFQEVFNQVATHLTLRETEYFGLALKKDKEYHFISNDEKIHKHAPKNWKSSNGEGFDGHGQPVLTVYFRVQFYVDQVVLLREKATRHLYFLQLKENVLNYGHVCTEEKCFQFAALALQADIGSYSSVPSEGRYFDPREYFPAWIIEKRGLVYLVDNTPVVHKDLHNVPRSEAEWRFIKETTVSPAAHNLHFYRLKKRKTDKTWNAWLGICAKGIQIYEDQDDGFKDLISTFLWPDIGKLTFDKKKFEIRSLGSPAGRKFAYYTECDSKSKYLLSICRNTHMFQMAIQPKLVEIRHLEAEDKRRYRESYIYSDARDLVTNGGPFKANRSPRSKTVVSGNQRFSVISDASSNTTSGIASDKMTVSFEESDEHSREIIIDCPPRAGNFPGATSTHLPRGAGPVGISTLPGYKHSPIPGLNKSPVLNSKDFPAYTFPINRAHSNPNQFAGRMVTNPNCVPSQIPVTNASGQSIIQVISSANSNYVLQQQQGGVYGKVIPMYSVNPTASPLGPTKEKTSRPASRSGSRKDSFKEILGQLQVHSPNLPPSVVSPSTSVDTPWMAYVQPVHLDTLETHGNSPIGSDPRSHRSYTSDDSNQSTAASTSTVRSGDIHYQTTSHSSASLGSMDFKFRETEDYIPHEFVPPPPMFTDEGAKLDAPPTALIQQGPLLTEQTHVNPPETDAPSTKVKDQKVTSKDNDNPKSKSPEGASGVVKKSKPTHITVQNQKEVLHPEIEEIRDQSHAFSLPFITALCNDMSLIPTHSNSGSIAGSYDMSTIHSTDSRTSRILHETDPRRLSANYPSGTMISIQSNRPFSWHSEGFDLDAQLATQGMNGGLFYPYPTSSIENHRSVPQNLSDFTTTNPTSSWAHTLAYNMPYQRNADQYSPELIASHLMIPPRLSSGGHNGNTEENIRHKSLNFKENVGIA